MRVLSVDFLSMDYSVQPVDFEDCRLLSFLDQIGRFELSKISMSLPLTIKSKSWRQD